MYKFTDEQGQEASLSNARQWVEAVRGGRIGPSTLVFDPTQSRWRQAREMQAFRVAMAALEVLGPGRVEVSSMPETGKPEGLPPRPGATSPQRTVHPHPDAVGPNKHEWQGVLYYWLTYIGALVFGVGAVAVAGIMLDYGEDGAIVFVTFLLMAGLAAFSFFLARGIQRFEPWARIAALILAYLSVLGGLVAMIGGATGGERVGGVVPGILSVIFIVYFHGAKDLFADNWNPNGAVVQARTDVAGEPPGADQPIPQQGFASEVTGNDQGSKEPDRRSVRLSCPHCDNAEVMLANALYDHSAYRSFRPKEGFWRGGWTLTCTRCGYKMPYNPYELRAQLISG